MKTAEEEEFKVRTDLKERRRRGRVRREKIKQEDDQRNEKDEKRG